jgi:hypothetical protein
MAVLKIINSIHLLKYISSTNLADSFGWMYRLDSDNVFALETVEANVLEQNCGDINHIAY